jgi:hypothetical protein
MAGFPEARIHASGIPWQRARKGSISGSKYGKNLSPAVKQRWSAFEAQPDSHIAPCEVEWEDSYGSAGKTLRATFVIGGGSSGVPAARRSFTVGPLCDWYAKGCQTQGYVAAR